MDVQDKRGAPRHRVLKDGKIVSMDKWSIIDCSIRDLSETGARLACEDPLTVPEHFRLIIPSYLTIRDASVVWRRKGQVGVRFVGPARPAPPRKW